MTKHKNRKKEFLKKQKVVEFKDYKAHQESFDFGEQWENEQLLGELQRLGDEEPEKLTQMVHQMILDLEDELTPEEFLEAKKEMGLDPAYLEFIHAISEADYSKRKKNVQELVRKYPNHYAIRLEYLALEENFFDPEVYREYEVFLDWTMRDWEKLGYLGASNEDAIDYVEGCRLILGYYLMVGFYGKALTLTEFFLQKVGRDYLPGFEILVLSVYNANFALKKVEDFAKTLSGNDSAVQIQLMVAYLLAGDFAKARVVFNALARRDKSILALFSAANWMDIFTAGELDTDYPIGDIDEALDGLHFLYPMLVQRKMLQIQINLFAEDYLEEHNPFKEIKSNLAFRDKGVIGRLGAFTNVLTLMNQPELKGIRMDLVDLLVQKAGIKSVSDFKKKTESQILAIKGIGKGTVEKLKKNGVIFKKE